MAETLNFTFKPHVKQFYIEDGDDRKYRWPVLVQLMMYANRRHRAWPTHHQLAEDLETTASVVSKAIQWLLTTGAIVLVPYGKREGAEKRLPARKYIYYLTGVVRFSGYEEAVPYSYENGESIADAAAALEKLDLHHMAQYVAGEVATIATLDEEGEVATIATSKVATIATKGTKGTKGTKKSKVVSASSDEEAATSGAGSFFDRHAGISHAASTAPDIEEAAPKNKAREPRRMEEYDSLDEMLCDWFPTFSKIGKEAEELLSSPCVSDDFDDLSSPRELFASDKHFREWVMYEAPHDGKQQGVLGFFKKEGARGARAAARMVRKYDWFLRWYDAAGFEEEESAAASMSEEESHAAAVAFLGDEGE